MPSAAVAVASCPPSLSGYLLSIYKEWLETKGEGLHHIACMAHTQEESDEIKQRLAGLGAGVMMGGRIGETIEFFYLDTEPMLKAIIESGSGHAVDLKPVYIYPRTDEE